MVNENLAFAAMAEFAHTLVQRYAIADVLSQLTEQVPPVLEIFAASVFADMAASYLANASDLQRSDRVREQLTQALDSRVIIEQATGIIAERQRVTVDIAFQRLRRYTRDHNARLHDVAEAVVHLGLRIER